MGTLVCRKSFTSDAEFVEVEAILKGVKMTKDAGLILWLNWMFETLTSK